MSFCFFCWERLLKNMKRMTGRKAISMRTMLPPPPEGPAGPAGGGAPWLGVVVTPAPGAGGALSCGWRVARFKMPPGAGV
jgi:hypothetical protein